MLETRLLHLVARAALRAWPPLRAKRAVDAVGSLWPPLCIGEAMRIAAELEGRGTCLSRALVVASRVPGAEVVIGSDGPSEGAFGAHAWVEADRTIVTANEPSRYELARF